MTVKHQLPRSPAEAQGISSSAILGFVDALEQNLPGIHSFMLLRHGQVVAEGWWSPYAPEYPHTLWSLSKSFTATAVGLAIEAGLLSVNDAVLSFFPDDAPAEVSENLAAMQVRHLLSMSTGHAEDTTSHLHAQPDGNWVKAFLAQPVAHRPGTHFVYNSGATYMLSAIVQTVTGMNLVAYLQPRLFQPLGIEGATWETCPRGINTGGWGLNLTTEAIARFGQLYLQKGIWEGTRIVPESWVAVSTARQVSNGSHADSDWEQGYGYQFWRCRYGAYRGDGAFGQFCVVMPEQDAVLAMTAGVADMQAVLNQVWTHLLPALGPTALPENQTAQEELARRLAGLSLPPPQGRPTSPLAAKLSGRTYRFDANDRKVEAITFDFGEEACRLTMHNAHGEHQVVAGYGVWLKGTTTIGMPVPQPVAASGAWTADDEYVMKLCFYETSFCPTITCRFTADQLLYDYSLNVSFGPLQLPQLRGRMA